MTEESANWCRFAQLMIDKGAKVLRTFIQVEIITSIFRDYSTAWRKRMNAINVEYTKKVLKNLDCKLDNSTLKPLENLRGSWSSTQNETPMIHDQIDELKQWKTDIEWEQKHHYVDCILKRMDEWSKQIERELRILNRRHNLYCKWSNTFLIHMYKSQRNLFLKMEENYKFLNEPLISKYKLSPKTVPSEVEVLKSNLWDWKNDCNKVLQAFRAECFDLIRLGQEAAEDEILIDCLEQFKIDVDGMNVKSQIETLCGSWYSELEEVFIKCDNGELEETIQMLERIPSYKEMKIKTFFSQLIPHSNHRKRKRMKQQFSKFQNVSEVKDLENLDLTLLVAALKEGDIVNSHAPYGDEDVPDWDKSTGADILRLKSFRNEIVSHIPEAKLSSEKFDELWKKVTRLLRRIAKRCGDNFKTKISLEIDKMKKVPLEPLKIKQLRQEYTEWCKQDIQFEFPSNMNKLWDLINTAEQNMRKVHPCPKCNVRCDTEGDLEKHMNTNHVFRCPKCSVRCDTKRDLEKHMNTNHDSGAAGVAAGASAGAAVGLVLGPPGAVVGAAVGGLLGFLGVKK